MAMTRDELVALVRVVVSAELSESETSEAIERIERNVPYSGVTDLMFWSEPSLTPEQVVDTALSYKPIPLPALKRPPR